MRQTLQTSRDFMSCDNTTKIVYKPLHSNPTHQKKLGAQKKFKEKKNDEKQHVTMVVGYQPSTASTGN